MGSDVDYAKAPSEDFASMMIEFEDGRGPPRHWRGDDVVELRRRRSAPLGRAARPRVLDVVEYARQRTQAVLQPRGAGPAGEDLVEKQNAEVGQMPVVADEPVAYGYEAEDRHFVRAFLGLERLA
jgi:hypothetical protein